MFTTSLVSIAVSAALLVTPSLGVTPVGVDAPPPPKLTAERWIVYDAEADVVLASWNANDRAPMASVTKVMTAIVALATMQLSPSATRLGEDRRKRSST
jgi:D-alanyl-D-alanine carboxypeptidase